jgi:hypothetical protein
MMAIGGTYLGTESSNNDTVSFIASWTCDMKGNFASNSSFLTGESSKFAVKQKSLLSRPQSGKPWESRQVEARWQSQLRWQKGLAKHAKESTWIASPVSWFFLSMPLHCYLKACIFLLHWKWLRVLAPFSWWEPKVDMGLLVIMSIYMQ